MTDLCNGVKNILIESFFKRMIMYDSNYIFIIKNYIRKKSSGESFSKELFSCILCYLLKYFKQRDIDDVEDIFNIMVKLGIDINKKTSSGDLPIFCLLENKNINVINLLKLMIEKKVNLLEKNKCGFNTIQVHLSTPNINKKVINILLKEGVGLNDSKNLEWYNALHCYLVNNITNVNIGMVNFLISKGCEITSNCKNNDFVLFNIIKLFIKKNKRILKKNTIKVFNFLIKNSDVNKTNLLGYSFLNFASYFDNNCAFRHLLNLGYSVDVITSTNETCATLAFVNENVIIVNMFLKKQPNFKTMDATFFQFENYIKHYNLLTSKKILIIKNCIAYSIIKMYELKYKLIFNLFKDFIVDCKNDALVINNLIGSNVNAYNFVYGNLKIHYSYFKNIILKKRLTVYGKVIVKKVKKYKCMYNKRLKLVEIISKKCERDSLWNTVPNEIKLKIISKLSDDEINNIISCVKLKNKTIQCKQVVTMDGVI
ncbi:148R [Yaba monkey tumor virus]|uniref:148R n=1 Tax=Yaba monkey tumor virus (strain VR587) TaxID=928314 RepID=Q6TUM6_YMTV5|nr:ankyrin-like protein [Yaba monkey tumor virus]AAR07500.1 148R [Yaba monkey tumor virus]